jgi:hypothetical protein
MNTQESNKLIAEFMGGIPSSVPNLINLPQTIGESRILCVKGSEGLPNGTYEVKRINDLKYHSSWDWLMPVLVKIDTYANSDSLSIAEYEEYRNKYPLIAEVSIYDEILDTHKQVVQFIKSIQLPF